MKQQDDRQVIWIIWKPKGATALMSGPKDGEIETLATAIITYLRNRAPPGGTCMGPPLPPESKLNNN
jgi:hypothetical protein